MKALSPLQLQQHFFTHLLVKPNITGTRTGKLNLDPSISFQKLAQNERQWVLILGVALRSTEPQAPFCYEAEIGMQGTVEIHEAIPTEKREQIALVNGFSLLYSAIREMLLNVTARCPHGPVCLPVLNFQEIVADKTAQEGAKEVAPEALQTIATPAKN